MDLSITVNGIKFPNPFLLGSGPPGTNARVIAKSYDAGWGGAVAKTVSFESSKVVNVVPRYGKLRSRNDGEVIGFEPMASDAGLLAHRSCARRLRIVGYLGIREPRRRPGKVAAIGAAVGGQIRRRKRFGEVVAGRLGLTDGHRAHEQYQRHGAEAGCNR